MRASSKKGNVEYKGEYFTSGHPHVTHTTVTTQQFQTSAVSFGSFLDASFTAEKSTEQTHGGEKLEVENLALSCGVSSKVFILQSVHRRGYH